jgi:hypothetical protein
MSKQVEFDDLVTKNIERLDATIARLTSELAAANSQAAKLASSVNADIVALRTEPAAVIARLQARLTTQNAEKNALRFYAALTTEQKAAIDELYAEGSDQLKRLLAHVPSIDPAVVKSRCDTACATLTEGNELSASECSNLCLTIAQRLLAEN